MDVPTRGRATVFRRMVLGALGVAAVAYLGVAVLARTQYPRLLYPAPKADPDARSSGGALWTLRAADDVPVHALHFSAGEGAPVLVHFHGNGVAMGQMAWEAHALQARGVSVVLCEYRGYGLSVGVAPSEAGLYADAEAVLAELGRRGIAPTRIVLYGESLGSGVAAEMAARGRGSALVLFTPYTSITAMGALFAPFLPVGLLLRERLDTLAKAPGITMPSLVLHGTADEVVPYWMGETVARALPRGRLITVPGGHHTDLYLGPGARYLDEVAAFAKASAR